MFMSDKERVEVSHTSSPSLRSSTNSGSKMPSSLDTNGSCLTKALPGSCGIMICTVLASSSRNHWHNGGSLSMVIKA